MPTINSPATIIALLKRAKTAYQKVKPDPKTKPELRLNDIVKDLQRLQDIVRKKANKGSDKLVKPFNARKRIVLKKLTEHRKSINTTAEKKVDGNTAQLPAFIKALLKITTAVLRLNFATATPDEEKISLEGLEEGNLVELDKLDQLSNEELNNLEREDSDDLPEQVPITTESLTNSLKSIQQTNAQEFLRLSQKLNNAAKLKQQGIQPGMLDKVLRSIREEIDNAAKSTPRVEVNQKQDENGKQDKEEILRPRSTRLPPPKVQPTTSSTPPLQPITTEFLANALKNIEKTNASEFSRLSQKLKNAEKLPEQGVQPGMLDKVLRAIKGEIDNAAKGRLPKAPGESVDRPSQQAVEKNQDFIERKFDRVPQTAKLQGDIQQVDVRINFLEQLVNQVPQQVQENGSDEEQQVLESGGPDAHQTASPQKIPGGLRQKQPVHQAAGLRFQKARRASRHRRARRLSQ